MSIKRVIGAVLGIFVLWVAPACTGRAGADANAAPAAAAYQTGLSNVVGMVEELGGGKTPSVYLESETMPVLTVRCKEQGSPGGAVCFSKGFVDLVNFLAHAKAVDEEKRGALKSYTGQITGRAAAPDVLPPVFANPAKAWSDGTINLQMGYFNQMGGGLIAVEQACVSLGYSRKLNGQAQPGPGKPAALSDSLSLADWRMAVLTGASNAVMNGYFTPGLVAFYQTLDEMKVKPPWVRYFMPPGAKLGKLAKEIRWVEEDLLEKGTSTQLLRTARSLP